ncbi:MAG: hypothetical protein H6700_11355, partial [Myxococcales bacterium]|nr:hypothetical protein [Myxococcales bacterium]
MSFFLGAPPASHCGNGIIEDGEQCEGGIGCDACHFRASNCSPDTGCPPIDCASTYIDGPEIDCSSTPVGPCQVAACDDRLLACVPWPTYEGEPCVDGSTEGWCRGGVCDPTPEECALCARGYRLVDGVCQPEEEGWTFVAGRSWSASILGGATDATPWRSWSPLSARINGERTADFAPSPLYISENLSRGGPLVPTGPVVGGETHGPKTYCVEYFTEPWERDVRTYDLGHSIDELGVEIPPHDEGLSEFCWGYPEPSHSTFSTDALLGLWLVFDNLSSHTLDDGSMLVTRARASGTATSVCEVAVDVDGEWKTCPERPGATVCDGQCIDTRTNALNCGECGHACGDAEICAGGECVCDPRLAGLDLPTCAWDACPDGWYGPGCRSACPG